MLTRDWGTSKIAVLEVKKIEFLENIFLRNRVSPYDHFAEGIKGIGLYISEKSWLRSQELSQKSGPKNEAKTLVFSYRKP